MVGILGQVDANICIAHPANRLSAGAVGCTLAFVTDLTRRTLFATFSAVIGVSLQVKAARLLSNGTNILTTWAAWHALAVEAELA